MRPITDASDLLTVYIDSLFLLPTIGNIKNIRIVARLCYGNVTKTRKSSQLMSVVRDPHQHENVAFKPLVRFNQWISFNDARLCELQREALLLFEIYASYHEEVEPSSTSENFDGVQMHLMGWCSQALFDHEHQLITGERYLGMFRAEITNRTGFYSLRNVFKHNCPILSIFFLDQNFFWPEIQARNDIPTVSLTAIHRDKQEHLCRLLKRPSLLLADYSGMISTDHRRQSPLSDEGKRIKTRARFLDLFFSF